MRALLDQADAFLRPPGTTLPGQPACEVCRRLIALVCLGGMVYGVIMGSFGGVGGERLWQLMSSASKVPILLLGTFVLCLPSFFVLNTLAGLRPDFGRVLEALLAAQAGMTVVLCSLAPFTLVWYLSSDNYHAAILFNGFVFAAAGLITQGALRRRYRPLIERSRKHLLLLRSWLILYGFVGLQLGWLLRPFVGEPGTQVQLFRSDAWGNAYVEVFRHLVHLFSP